MSKPRASRFYISGNYLARTFTCRWMFLLRTCFHIYLLHKYRTFDPDSHFTIWRGNTLPQINSYKQTNKQTNKHTAAYSWTPHFMRQTSDEHCRGEYLMSRSKLRERLHLHTKDALANAENPSALPTHNISKLGVHKIRLNGSNVIRAYLESLTCMRSCEPLVYFWNILRHLWGKSYK